MPKPLFEIIRARNVQRREEISHCLKAWEEAKRRIPEHCYVNCEKYAHKWIKNYRKSN